MLSGASCIYLIFDQKFDKGTNSTGQVEVFNGSIWQNVYNIDTNISTVNNQVINISAVGAGIFKSKTTF